MQKIFCSFFSFICIAVHAQDTTGAINFSGYIEAYYSYDFNRPAQNAKPFFIYNYNRHNEFTVNLGLIKAAYSVDRVRANLAIGIGTYMNANYSAEPATFKNIFEANAGYRLSKQKKLWLDFGILPSHIGFETAIGKDNWNLTRSLVAENCPYFESGARLSYTTSNDKLFISLLALNGWQRIQRVPGNSLTSFGAQIYYKPSTKLTLNYSNFMGTDKPDSARLWRYYHNLYSILQLTKKIGITAGLDIGTEQKTPHSNKYNLWYSPIIILRISPADKWAVALRGEYFSDKNNVIITTAGAFKTFGSSLNIDFLPAKNISLRMEGRILHSKTPIFKKNEILQNNNTSVSFSTAVSF